MSNKIYNEEIKDRFLEKYDNEGTILTTKYLFFNSYIIESTLNKDLYDFTLDEIGQLISSTNPKSAKIAHDKKRLISNYISWAISNNFRKDNISPLQGVEDEWCDKYVDETIKQFISKKELNQIVSELINYQDKIVPVLIFNGIYGHQCSELRNLRITDINEDTGIVQLVDDLKGKREVHLDEDVIELIKKANSEPEYHTKNGLSTSKNPTSELNDTEFVLKAVKRGTTSNDPRISQITIINRIKMIAEMFNMSELTPKSIQRSGMLYLAHILKNDEEAFNKIGDHFNWSKLNNNGYLYYNTNYFRNFINEENLEMLYGIEE